MPSSSVILKHLCRGANRGQLAGFQDHRTVRHAAGLSRVVGDDHAGHPALANDIQYEVLDLSRRIFVECRGWLVQKKDFRIVRQGSCYRHALSLSAGKIAHASFLISREVDALKESG